MAHIMWKVVLTNTNDKGAKRRELTPLRNTKRQKYGERQDTNASWLSDDRTIKPKLPSCGFRSMLPLNELLDVNGGFMVNGEVKIVAEVGVLEVVRKSDVLVETSLVMESIDVNGFQVLPSQVESVKSLFEKHPDIASKFRPKNPHLRTTSLNSLLSLTEILCHCQSPEELSIDDLANAYSTLICLTKAGFKLD
ncbi:hypothetical protein [Arabidopsis thaliana]|nr:Ubiquitin-specific protease family C19-related protein [Arabidopsis thaliana]AAG51277.1 hypothetical protein [Arabidopsis thaliana]AEE31348.1 Ubiquitin-specific protease family C19-related protein [Arabidopsis thaliana]|eukprot:NP_174422.1 Ubiquitin-specific protease family C19-related protein [Arabidopsis thaliana]